MATDTTNIPTDLNGANVAHEGEVERATLTQGVTEVQLPAGEPVVRIQVTPGETIRLPFPQDAMVARLDDGNGNLAVKVGDITVILQGYIAAVGEADVTLLDNTGREIDVAAVVAATDPNIDIQTAAGPAAGAPGAENTGGVFDPFAPQAGLGGLNAIGGLNPTALDYGLLERQFILTDAEEVDTTVDTVPEIVGITGGVVNEDDLGGGEGNDFLASKALEPYPSHIVDGLSAHLGMGSAWWGQPHGDGNDPFDTDDHEEGSQQSGLPDDNGNGVDQDREPTTVTGVVSVNFFADVPGRLSFENGGTTPIIDQLTAMGLTSHSHQLQYIVLPRQPDDPATSGVDESHGETLVAYYVETWTYGEQTYSYATIVFTIAFREYEGTDPLTDFNVDFTIYGVVDNVPGITDAKGDITDALDIGVPFFVIDSNGTVVPVPADALIFRDIDDVPSLGGLEYDWQTWLPVSITPTDTDLVHDESKGEQNGTDDVPTSNWQIDQALAAAGWGSLTPLGAAQTYLDVSFGADGSAQGNKEADETVFAGDAAGTYATGYQLYLGAADSPQGGGTTNWSITLDGLDVNVLARQVDANTIQGYALDDQQNEIPVFVLYLDPQSGYLTFVQLHQINHDDLTAVSWPTVNESNESSPSLLVGGLPVSFRATDYDGDHVDAPLTVTTLDDAPTLVSAWHQVVVDEDFLTKATNGEDGNKDVDGTSGDAGGNTKAVGNLGLDFGTDVPGHYEVVVDPADFAGMQTTGGKNILLVATANQVTGYADVNGNGELDPDEEVDGNRVFLFQIDGTTGDFSLEIFQALKHDNPEGVDSVETDIDVHFTVKGIDVDGDSIDWAITFKVNDDAPTISVVEDHSVTIRLDESIGKDPSDPNTAPEDDDTLAPGAIGQSKGNVGTFFTDIGFGADGPMGGINNPNYALVLRNVDGSTAEIGTTQVPTNLYVTDPNNLYANDNIFLVAISAYQVNGYIHYEGPDSPNNILALTIQIDQGWAEVTVTQYLPIAHDVKGDSPAAHDDIASLTVDAAGGIFASATVIDGDGDKVTAIADSPISFVIEDDGPKLEGVVHDSEGGEPGPFLIDEDALKGGVANGPGDNDGGASVAYKLNVDFGTDGGAATSFVFFGAVPSVGDELKSADGQPIGIGVLGSEVNGMPAGTLIGYTGFNPTDPASWVFTATIDQATGAGTFTLLKPLYHPLTDNPDSEPIETAFEDNITLTLKVRAYDGDGDWVAADIVIDIDDDSPAAANVVYDGDPVTEGGQPVYLWTLADFLDANVQGGADGYKAGSLAFGPGSLGGTLEIVDDGGVMKIKYTPPASVDGNGNAPVDETFSYSVKDNDNDMVTASVTVAVADGDAPLLGKAKGKVDEEGLANGIAGVPAYNDGSDIAGESKTTGGTLNVTLGSDPLAADNPFNLTETNNLNGLKTLDGKDVVLDGPTEDDTDPANTILTYVGYKDGGDANTPADQVFVLTLNRDTGQWSFELKQPVKHPTADTEDNLVVEFGVSVTDIDGSTGSNKIVVMIDDDSPLAMLSTYEAPSQVLLDETAGQQVGDSDLTGGVSQATGGFQVSALFSSQYGADGAGNTSYALTQGNGDSFGTEIGTGTPSGLYATSVPGTEIYLFQNGDVVEGRIGNDPAGDLAFTVSLVGGEVQVEQWLALKHPSPAHQESVSMSLVYVTQTITDADGDSDSIGRAMIIGFYDDGPSVTVNTGDESAVILQTRDAYTDGDPTDSDSASSQADFSGVFSLTKNAGADGEKSSSLTYELVFMPGFAAGGQSGLSIDGDPIYLHQIGGVMVGSTSAIEPASAADPSVVFTVAVDSQTGIVTLTQLRQVDHDEPEGAPDYDDDIKALADGKIGLKATGTLTDGDDDVATDSETVDLGGNIRFADDGPIAGDEDFGTVVEGSAQTTLSTIADFLAANVQAGADEYKDGSFTLMNGANPVTSVVGSLGGTLAIVGGELRYTPPASVDNDNPGTETFTYRVSDKDGDTETGQITVSITDGAAPALVAANGAVDEEGLPNGLAGTVYGDGSDIAGESKTTGGTLSVTMGSDPLAADNAFNLTGVNNLGGLKTLDGTDVVLDGPTASGDAANTILTYIGYKSGGSAANPADQVFVLTLNRDTGQWSFELKQPVKHPTADTEDNLVVEFGVSVTDIDGSTGTNKIVVTIDDDSPDAKDDFDSVANLLTTDGNVITGAGTSDPASGKDATGADGASVSAIASTTGNQPSPTTDASHGDGFTILGEFGTLTIYADGYYTYTRSNGAPLVDSDVFTYTLKDGDGDTDTAKLTIYIYDEGTELDLNPTGEDSQQVNEKGLPIRTINAKVEPAGTGEAADGDGTDNDDPSETTTGTMSFKTPDGLDQVTIQGKDGPVVVTLGAIVHGLYGDLEITSFSVDGSGNGSIGYTYTLKDNADHTGGAVSDDFAVVVTDSDGDQSSGTLAINIVDDAPDARNDFDSVANFLTTDGNVITGVGTSDPNSGKDLVGADNAAVSAIASVNVGGNVPTPTTDATHGDGFVIQGEFGTLTIYADGYYTYTRTNGVPLVNSDVFTYTLKDGDTDTDTATLTINIYDTGTELTVTDNEVNEKGLPIRTINSVVEPAGTGEAADGNGANNDDKSEATTGSITFFTPDGFGALTIQGKDGPVTITGIGNTVEGLHGTLVVTAFDGPGGSLSYTYTLKDNADHSGGSVSDDFVVVVTDADGDQSTDTLNINIVDDAPIADDDNGGNVNAGATIEVKDAASGVLANDLFGADDQKSGGGLIGVKTGQNTGESTTDIGVEILGFLGGKLTLNADGTYTYTAPTNASGTEYFTYTIEDGDGDRDTAVLSFNVADPAEGLISGKATVYEDGIKDQHTGGTTKTPEPMGITFSPNDNEVMESLTLKLLPAGWKVFYDGVEIHTGTGADFTMLMSQYSDITKLAILPPADNLDSDLALGIEASIKDPNGGLTGTISGTLNITRDAVADKPTNVEIIVKDSPDANASFGLGETGTLQVKATFGDTDGSEVHTVTVTLHPGFTAALDPVGNLNGYPYTYNAATGVIVFTVPTGIGSINETFDITAPNTGTLPGTLKFDAVAKAEETTLSGNEETTDNNVATTEATTGIPSSRLLDGTFKTNTNVNNQQLIITFVDRTNPLMAVAQVYSLNLQGQQGNVLTDAGFDINKDHQYLVSIEAAVNPKVIVTDLSLENVVLQSSGNLQLELNDTVAGADRTAYTFVIKPDTGTPDQTATASTDGDSKANTIGDPSGVQFNYLYGASGNDVLTGGAQEDLLHGGDGKDELKGEGGNDILVFDSADTLIDGGAGFDILRIDQGAIANTTAAVGGATSGTVDVSLVGNPAIKNIESILITTEAKATADFGTKVILNAADVLNFTDNIKDADEATAHSLYIVGAKGDQVDIDGLFNAAGFQTDPQGGATWQYVGDVVRDGGMVFAQYNSTVSGTDVTLYVDKDVQVI